MRLDRRTVLKFGVVGAAVLAVGGVGLAVQGTRLREARAPLVVLDAVEFSVLAAIADRLEPGGDGLPSAWDLRVPERIDAFLATLHPAAAAELKQVLRLMENALVGFTFDQRLRPFTALSEPAQDRALEAWRTSRVGLRRAAFKAVAALCSFTYWATPEAGRATGYPGPPDHSAVVRPSIEGP